MTDLPRPIKRMLREQAARAHEEELRRALVPLAGAFDRWRAGELDSFALSDLIHEFHDGEAREIWGRYDGAVAEFSVAHAIHTGILKRDTVPPPLLNALARHLAFYELQDDRPADREIGSPIPTGES